MNSNLVQEFSPADHDPIEFNPPIHQRIKLRPMYFERGFSPTPQIFGRFIVLDRLLKAVDLLPKRYGFMIWDVYRPRAIQRQLFEWMQREIKKKSPRLTAAEVFLEAKKYMSPPADVGSSYCPPHLSGGAIDLTLYEVASGKELAMGTSFDDCTDKAHSQYYDFKMELTQAEEEIKRNRQLLRSIMTCMGFTAYQYEWWHFDIGDLFWSQIVGKPEIFGPLFGDEEWPSNRVGQAI